MELAHHGKQERDTEREALEWNPIGRIKDERSCLARLGTDIEEDLLEVITPQMYMITLS